MTFSIHQVKRTMDATLPPRTMIHSLAKVGKSTFASGAPSAIFIQVEDGLSAIDTNAFPLATEWQDILSAVASLYQEDHEYKTVVLDSADWAEKLANARVCKDHNVKGIESIGYGKGFSFAADLFSELLEGLNALRIKKGMHIVILAHTEIRRFDDPLAASYDRWQPKLSKMIVRMVSEWCDVIGFAQIEAVTKTEKEQGFKPERVRALTTGRRILNLQGSPAFDAGNRYGLPASIALEWGEYEKALAEARGTQPEETEIKQSKKGK